MTLLQTNVHKCGGLRTFGVLREKNSPLVIVDLDSLSTPRKHTIEEMEQDSELRFLLNFPTATDEEIQAIEAAVAEVNQWKTI